MSQKDTIVERFKVGDPASEKYIFNLLYKPLFYFANNLISDPEESKDIVNTAFVKLWQMRESFTDIENIRRFMYIATRNLCFDILRRHKTTQSFRKELSYIQPNFVTDDEIFRAEVEAILLQALKDEIERLPRRCRTIFKMIHFDNLSTAEIADRLGLSKKTVLAQKARAAALIKTAILKRKLLFLLWGLILRHFM